MNEDQLFSFKKIPNNLENWIRKKFNLHEHILVHNNKNCKNKYKFNRFFLPNLNNLSEIYRFNLNFFKFLFLILIDLLFLRIKQISIFSEIVKLSCALSKDKDYYKNSFFFFSEQPFFRPLYTYFTGKNVFYIENNLNIHPIYLDDNKKEKGIFWKNLTWENYLVWNIDQKNFFEKNQIIDAKYFVSGPISFGTENSYEIDDKFKKSILIFDAIPFRRSYISKYNIYAASFHENKIIKFLSDICKLSDKYPIYIKQKRLQKKKIYSKKYKRYIEKNSKLKILNPNYSPQDIIEKFDKIICLPFSSTAWIAKEMNKKVCYYDVSGIHKDFGNNINGVPIIRSFPDLQNWSNS